MKHNFEGDEETVKEKVKEMEGRVNARHKQADPEHFFKRGNIGQDIGQRCLY